jgi:hypothetical protein
MPIEAPFAIRASQFATIKAGMFADLGNLGIEIRLQPESNASVIGLELGNQGYSFSGNLKDLTGLNLKEFYETFKRYPPQGCMYVNAIEQWRYAEVISPDQSKAMSHKREEEFLTSKLTDDNDCELPCWWSIVPGETTTQDAQK